MARSTAIILMLEGHFTGAALADVYRDNSFGLYRIWATIHGITKPLFFVVTGLVFSFVLFANREVNFRQNPRVKIGLRRITQLLFWGYFIQLNLLAIVKYWVADHRLNLEWLGAFHVLQSLAFGMMTIIIVYAVYALIKKGNMLWYYGAAAFIALYFHGELLAYMRIDESNMANNIGASPQYWPQHAPAFIQNMFYGKYADFSFISTVPLILLGATLGIIIQNYKTHIRGLWFGLGLVGFGLLLKLFAHDITWGLDQIIRQLTHLEESHLNLAHYNLARFGEVTMLIALFLWIENYTTFKAPLFLKMGQNTFAIYVIHIIILYGGIFGIGLKPRVFNHNLEPLQAIMVSIVSILFFALIAKYIEPLTKIYNTLLRGLGLKRK
jgi:hypothetical protein